MLLSKLIESVKEEKPNNFELDKLTDFVNDIESQIVDEIGGLDGWQPYTYEDDAGVELLAKRPYDRLYKSYLKAQIDYANEEYDSYANNVAQHNQDYSDYLDYLVRERESVNTLPSRFKNIF